MVRKSAFERSKPQAAHRSGGVRAGPYTYDPASTRLDLRALPSSGA